MLDLFVRDLFASAIRGVAERHRHPEEVRSQVEAAAEERRVGVVRGQKSAAEEERQLLALSPEVEVEVLDAEERKREIERVVVKRARQGERALLRNLLLDDARTGRRGIRNEIPHSPLGVADHLEVRLVRLEAPLLERRRVDRDVLHLHVALDRCRPPRGGEDLRAADLQRKSHLGVAGHRKVGLGLDVREGLALQVELDRVASEKGERLRVDPHLAPVGWFIAQRFLRRVGDFVRAPAVHVRRAVEDVPVVLGQPDVEGKRRDLLRLQDGDLRQRLALPLHAVQVEILPDPVGRLAAAEEEGAADRQVEGLVDVGHAKAQRRFHLGREGGNLLPLAGVPRTLPRDDLVGGQPPLRTDLDGGPRVGALRGLQHDRERSAREVELQRLRAAELEIPLRSGIEVLDGGLRVGAAGELDGDAAGRVLREEENRRELLPVEEAKNREPRTIRPGGHRGGGVAGDVSGPVRLKASERLPVRLRRARTGGREERHERRSRVAG